MSYKMFHLVSLLCFTALGPTLPSIEAAPSIAVRETDARSIPLYRVTVNDKQGNDASDHFKILHHYHDPIAQTKTPTRDVSRPMNKCRDRYTGWAAGESLCTGPQTFGVICNLPDIPAGRVGGFYHGSCTVDDICIDGAWNGVNKHDRRAYCVKKQHFVNIARGALNTANSNVPQPESNAQDFQMVSQAVLTASDGQSPLYAEQLQIEAFMYGVQNRETAFVPLNDTGYSCSNCGRLGIGPVPGNASFVEAQVTLNSTRDAGNLYLVTTPIVE